MALTKRQKEVLNYLVGFINKNGYSPSFEEIAHALKLTSLATVHKHLSTLEKKGYIRRGYNQSRSIEVVQLPKPIREQVLDRHVVELPLAGRIAAGRPLEAVETNETISLADFARGQNTFVLQVKGESMRDDHILDAGGEPRGDRRSAGGRRRRDGEEVLPRARRESAAAAGEFDDVTDRGARRGREDSGASCGSAAQVLGLGRESLDEPA
jgi:SOS-response transcriptional repressor LexA